MRFIKIAVFLFLACQNCEAQNIVPNPGFEILGASLTTSGQIMIATDWIIPVNHTGTPDLYNAASIGPAAGPCDSVDVPFNSGGNAAAHGGNGYAGISVDYVNGVYEYITARLNIQLDPGETYIFSCWVLSADSSRYASNRIGALLSSTPPQQVPSGSGLLTLTPQFESNVIVTDNSNWTQLNFTPYTATGGEQYITLGFFRASGDPALQTQDLGAKNSGCVSFDNAAYYYIDDVSLVPSNVLFDLPYDTVYSCPFNDYSSIVAVTNIPVIWTDQAGDTLDFDAELIVPESGIFYTNPGDIYTYYIFGNNTVDSVKVVVIDAPVLNLGSDTTFCEGDTILLDATTSGAILYTWNTGDTLPVIYITDTGSYYVLVDNPGCYVSDTVNYFQLLSNPPVNLGEDSLFCFFDFDTLRLSANTNAIGYNWYPTGDTSYTTTVVSEGLYYVTVTRENGCTRIGGFEVLEVCPPTFFIPNAFTPDGDGINDIYKVSSENHSDFLLRIFDRFGRLIFQTSNPAIGWDGLYNGKECPIGVYTYKIDEYGFTREGEKDKDKILGTFLLYR